MHKEILFFLSGCGNWRYFGFVFVPGTVHSNPLEWFSLASDKLHHNVPVSSTLNILGGQFTDSPQFCVVLFPPGLPCEPYLSWFSLDYQLSFESRILLDSTLFLLPVPLQIFSRQQTRALNRAYLTCFLSLRDSCLSLLISMS